MNSVILSVPKSTVQSIIIRWKTSGTTNNKPRSGRPSLLSPRALRRLKATVRTNRWKTLSHITTEFNRSTVTNPVCSKTIRRRLMDLGFTPHIPKKKPLISEKNRVNRLKFNKLHGSWSIEQWTRSSGPMKVDLDYFIRMRDKKCGDKLMNAIFQSVSEKVYKEMVVQ